MGCTLRGGHPGLPWPRQNHHVRTGGGRLSPGGGGGETEGLRCGLRGVAGVHWPAVLARSGRRARCGEGAPPRVRGPARKDTPTGRCAHQPPRACGGASRWPRRGPRRTSRSGASARVGAIARASSVDGGRAVPDNAVQRRCLSWSGQHDVMGWHTVTLYGLHPVRPNGRIASVTPAPGACSPRSHSLSTREAGGPSCGAVAAHELMMTDAELCSSPRRGSSAGKPPRSWRRATIGSFAASSSCRQSQPTLPPRLSSTRSCWRPPTRFSILFLRCRKSSTAG